MSVVEEELTANEKRCTRCGEVKTIDNFARDSSKPRGIRGQCKPCRSALDKARVRPSRAKKTKDAPVPTLVSEPVTDLKTDAAEKKKMISRSEAHKEAILKLIDRHRTEFDRLVYSEQVRRGVISLNEHPREGWVSLN